MLCPPIPDTNRKEWLDAGKKASLHARYEWSNAAFAELTKK